MASFDILSEKDSPMTFTSGPLSFQQEQIQIDWISFNFLFSIESETIQRLMMYLYYDLHLLIWINETNDYDQVHSSYAWIQIADGQAYLTPWVQPYWTGVILSFRGSNAQFFYELMKESKLRWEFFSESRLGRIDLCYDRAFQPEDPEYSSFFHQSCQQYRRQFKRRIANVYQASSDKYMYRIGSRKSEKFGRVYPKDSGLRFETEFKPKTEQLHLFQSLFLSHSISEWESELIQDFYQSWTQWIDVESPYADWLRERVRKLRVQLQPVQFFFTTYLKRDHPAYARHETEILTILQLLSFLKTLSPQTERFAKILYYRVTFPFQDFFDYIHLKGNSYQRNRIVASIDRVNQPMVEIFAKESFRRYLPIPVIEYNNSTQGACLTLWIHPRLYGYRFSFQFPKEFLYETGKLDSRIKLSLIRMMTQPALRKEFIVETVVNAASYSNQQRIQLQERILYFLRLLIQENFLQSSLQVQWKKDSCVQEMRFSKLTPRLLSKVEVLYLTEVLSYP